MDIPNADLEKLGLIGPDKTTPSPDPKKEDKGASEVRISEVIRWRVIDIWKFLNMGGVTQVELAIIGLAETLTRSIAARMETDPLIGLKLEVGSCIHSCFHGDGGDKKPREPKYDVVPWKSFIVGFLVIMFIGMLPWHANLPIIPSLIITLLGIGMGFAGIKSIDIGHAGLLTVMGQRTRLSVSEGHHWTFWPIMGFETVDMRERIISLKDKTQIVVIAGNAKNAGQDIPEGIADGIDHNFREISGVDVIQVMLSEVLPSNVDIIRAREKILVEEAEAESQGVEMTRMTERAKKISQELGVSGDEALRLTMMQAGHYTRTEVVTDSRGGGDAGAFLATLIAAGQVAKGVIGKDNGQNDRKQDRKRNKGEGEPKK